MVSGVLEVRIPAWMSARDEREAVADMLARVEKKQGSSRRSDAQLEERARRLNAAFLDSRATVAVGAEKRDKAWDHPDFLPTAEHLDNPAAFIDSLLDDGPDEGFEEEFAKLEEMLKNGEDSSATQGDETGEADGQDEQKEKGNEDDEN